MARPPCADLAVCRLRRAALRLADSRAPAKRRPGLRRRLGGAVGKVNLGLTHAADMSFRQAVADVYRATVRDIHGFAASL